MQGHHLSWLQCKVITWEQTKKKKIISQKVQKAQALQHDVDQAGKTVPQKGQVKDLSLHFCFFRVPVLPRLLLFCLHIFLIRKRRGKGG